VRYRLALSALSALSAPSALFAQSPHDAQPERPTVATHAGTVAPGWLELETGAEYDRFSDATHALVGPVLFKLGVAKRVQLSLSVPWAKPAGSDVGFADLSAGLKIRLLDQGFLGRFAVLSSIKFPTGSASANRGTGTTDVSLLLVSSHLLGPVSMDLNAGVTRRSGDGSGAPRTATVWAASFGGPARGPLGWVFEVFGYPKTTGPSGSASTAALLGGPTYKVASWLVLDAGGIVSLTGPQPNAIYAGLTWNIGRYWGGRRLSPSP
jgi:hypothetical protein